MSELLGHRLKLVGLRDVDRILTHANRTVMVSLARRVLRLHRGYAMAPDRVLRAIVRFLDPRVPRATRRLAEREFLGFPVEEYAPPPLRPVRRDRPRPGDLVLLQRLGDLHQRLNLEHFGGTLAAIPIRLSGRMRTRLGELTVDCRTGQVEEIALSRHHSRGTPGPRSSTPFCMRWYTSGRRNPVSPSITARPSGARRASWASSPRRSAGSRRPSARPPARPEPARDRHL